MRSIVPVAIVGVALALVACGTTPPLPGFGIDVSVKLVPGGRQVCIDGKNFSPDTLVQTGYVDLPGDANAVPAQTVTTGHDGRFRVVDTTSGHSTCTPEQQAKDVVVFAKDLGTANVAIGKLPARLWCFDTINAVAADPRCP